MPLLRVRYYTLLSVVGGNTACPAVELSLAGDFVPARDRLLIRSGISDYRYIDTRSDPSRSRGEEARQRHREECDDGALQ